MMEAAIVTIGDELLFGQTIDTNSAWLGRRLSDLGIKINKRVSVGDSERDIQEALDEASAHADLILITGGLGPTRDDITRPTLAKYFNTTLEYHEELLGLLKEFFEKRGRELTDALKRQALLPASCETLRNTKGTAWGMWFEKNNKVFVSMPGVPREMQAITEEEVIPRLKERFTLPCIVHRHLLTAGVGESVLAEKVADLEDNLPHHIKLAYLPGLGTVKLRLTARGDDRVELEHELINWQDQFMERVGKYTYGFDTDRFEAAMGNILKQHKKTIATAESCTGGYIASLLTRIPGSSEYYMGSTVTYSNAAKTKVLHVPESVLEEHGAVSEETVKAMIKGVCQNFDTDYAISVSGIAGPAGGTPEKPVGTVWIAVGSPDNIEAKRYNFPGDREQNIQLTAIMALEQMRKYLLKHIG